VIYLDANATTPLDARVLATVVAELQELGNASSHHLAGRRAAAVVRRARHEVADLLGSDPNEVTFTSGATEANNLALLGLQPASDRCAVICPRTEHAAVLEPVEALRRAGRPVCLLPVDAAGRLDLDDLERSLGLETLLVSVMAVNNETGVRANLAAISEVVHRAGAFLHTDATQLLAWGPVDVDALGVDLLSLSAHKMHGPVGAGALYVRRDVRHRLTPRVFGGAHEAGLRSGTLNTPAIAGLGQAAVLAVEDGAAAAGAVGGLRDHLAELLAAECPGLVVHGAGTDRAPGTLNVALPHAPADQVLAGAPEIAASRGSACSGGTERPSHVLSAMGVTAEEIDRSMRLSLHRATTRQEVIGAAQLLAASAARVRQRNAEHPTTSAPSARTTYGGAR